MVYNLVKSKQPRFEMHRPVKGVRDMQRTFVVLVVLLGLVLITAPVIAQEEQSDIREVMPYQIGRSTVVYLRVENGVGSIWGMNPDGTNKRQLVEELGIDVEGLIRPRETHGEAGDFISYVFPTTYGTCVGKTLSFPDLVRHTWYEYEQVGDSCYLPDTFAIPEQYDILNSNSVPFNGFMISPSEGAGTSVMVGTCVSDQFLEPHLCWHNEGMKNEISESDLLGMNFRMGFNEEAGTVYFFDDGQYIYTYDPEGEFPIRNLSLVQ